MPDKKNDKDLTDSDSNTLEANEVKEIKNETGQTPLEEEFTSQPEPTETKEESEPAPLVEELTPDPFPEPGETEEEIEQVPLEGGTPGPESADTKEKTGQVKLTSNIVSDEYLRESSDQAQLSEESIFQESITPPDPVLEKKQDVPTDVTPRVIFKGVTPQKGPLKRSGKYFSAIDLGSHTIKVAGFKQKRKSIELIFLSIVEIVPGYPLPSNEKFYRHAILSALGVVLDGMEEWQKKEFVSSINSDVAVLRQIQYPSAVKDKLVSALKWEIGKFLPYGQDDVVVDAQILSAEEKNNKMDVLLSAVPKIDLQYHMEILSQAGLNPVIVDADALALINALMRQIHLSERERVLLIDVGAKTTILNMFQKKGLFFSRSLSIAGSRFTEELSSSLNISFTEAETLKRGESMEEDIPSPDEISNILKPCYSKLYGEIRKSIIFYNKQTGAKDFQYLFLSGGGIDSPGFKEFMEKRLGGEISVLSPIADMEVDGININKETLTKYGPQIALSIGLALRGQEQYGQ